MNDETPAHPITNFTWRAGRVVPKLDLVGPVPVAHTLAGVVGQFALHQQAPSGEHLLARDPLGVNKLFFAIARESTVLSANYWIDLVRAGCDPENIWSVPAGHLLTLAPERRGLALQRFARLEYCEEPWDPALLPTYAGLIRERLTACFRMLAKVGRRRPLYVTLSGGLDSTTIAVLTREFLGSFTAVTFAVGDPGSAESEDLRVAARVAADLGVPFLPVHATPDEILASLDEALLYGQDWRDFNVHCALVNLALARAIHRQHGEKGSPRPLLITGDGMNELMADYTPVQYRGVCYYPLPRLSRARLRRFLVTGLDAGDREVGIYGRYGIDTLQPYALCADAYTALPSGWLDVPGAKQALARAVLGDRIPAYVYERPKTRAQCGSEDHVGGTLAVLADAGIDGDELRRRFCQLFGLETGPPERFLSAGRYRFPTRYPDHLTSAVPSRATGPPNGHCGSTEPLPIRLKRARSSQLQPDRE